MSEFENIGDSSGIGIITALNGSIVATTTGCSSVAFNITGTWVATITIQATIDGINWNIVNGNIIATDTTTQFFSSNVFLIIPCGGFFQVRLIATAFTSGTVAISWNAGIGNNVVPVFNNVAASFQAIAHLNDGSGNSISSTSGSLNVSITNAAGASAVNIQDGGNTITIDGAVSLGSITGKTVVMKTGTLVTTATTVNQVILTYTVTAGKTLFLEYLEMDGVQTTPSGGTSIILGTISLETPSGTKVISKRCIGGGSTPISDICIPFSEPLPISSSTVIRVVTTPSATTSMTWNGNFGGYER